MLSNWVEVVYLGGLSLVLVLGVSILWPLLTVLLVLLAGREMFQMSVSLRRYLLTCENWVEMTMVAFVRYQDNIRNISNSLIIFLFFSVLLFVEDQNNIELKRHLAGICLLLSWGKSDTTR